jgi:Xaa-Pro dipeptidase
MPPADPAGYWVEHFEIKSVADASDLSAALPADLSHCAAIGEDISGAGFGSVNDPTLLVELDYQRAVKTDYEVECIAAANRRAAPAHLAAQAAFRAGACEFDIHQAYCRAAQHTDEELPYGNIIALNEHAAVLHYQMLDRESPGQKHSFLIDAGASYQGYPSDITRTWGTGPDFGVLIEAMHAAQQALCAQVKAGMDFVALNEHAHQMLATIMVEADIARADAGDVYESGVTRHFLPHGLGHLLGLQVHDAGGHLANARGRRLPPPDEHPWLRLTRTLEPGFVITIEPGLYFIDMLLSQLRSSRHGELINWRRVDQLKSFGGVRIEDDVVVEPTGHRNLTREAFDSLG